MKTLDLSRTLHRSLSERWRPEDVARTILDQRRSAYAPAEVTRLHRAAGGYRYSSMSATFNRAVDMQSQCATAAEVFGVSRPKPDPVSVRAFIDRLRRSLKTGKGLDFLKDRKNRAARKRSKLVKGHRAYNKRFRILQRMEKRYEKWMGVAELRDLAQIAQNRLASRVPLESMREPETACFIAWMAARLASRSVFTFGRQERAFDTIAEMLLARVPVRRVGKHPKGDWYAIALVHPVPGVVGQLTKRQKGRLLGEWFAIMRRSADILQRVAERDKPDLTNMIVHRGNDSSTWNEAAGAFNKARDGWLAVLYALGMDDALDSVAPGKALRLMAADVAWGHRAYGTGLDPDTRVWGMLPKPWEVLSGDRKLTRHMIQRACVNVGTPHGGWVTPREQRAVPFKPTPELVHGVVTADPTLAMLLKKAGYFGGYGHKTKTTVAIERIFDGEKLSADWA